MSAFDDASGVDYLPPSPLSPLGPPLDPGGAGALLGGAASPAPAAGAWPVSSAGPVPAGNGGRAALDLERILGAFAPPPQGGLFGPNTGRVLSSLGAGLSSAGQSWNKPALAAFASGAGASLQGGQQFDHQVQDARLKALHAAIAAFKAGDMAGYRQATLNLQALAARQRQQAAAASSSAAPAGAAAAPANNPPPPPSVTGNGAGPTLYGSPAPGTPASAANGASAVRPVPADVLAQANDAIARGASPEAVRQRLADRGFDSTAV
jgi:hypothetical protein